MKKIIPFFLLTIFLFNAIGYTLIFKCVEFAIKREMGARINTDAQSALTALQFDSDEMQEVEWLESGKEIRYEGRLYDIASIAFRKNGIIVYCLNDLDEDELDEHFNEHIKMNVASSLPVKKQSSSKVSSATELFFSATNPFQIYQPVSLITHSIIVAFSRRAFIEISSPPPESLS